MLEHAKHSIPFTPWNSPWKPSNEFYAICALCGAIDRLWSEYCKEGETPNITVGMQGSCPTCHNLALRHNEIAEWVNKVLAHHIEYYHPGSTEGTNKKC